MRGILTTYTPEKNRGSASGHSLRRVLSPSNPVMAPRNGSWNGSWKSAGNAAAEATARAARKANILYNMMNPIPLATSLRHDFDDEEERLQYMAQRRVDQKRRQEQTRAVRKRPNRSQPPAQLEHQWQRREKEMQWDGAPLPCLPVSRHKFIRLRTLPITVELAVCRSTRAQRAAVLGRPRSVSTPTTDSKSTGTDCLVPAAVSS